MLSVVKGWDHDKNYYLEAEKERKLVKLVTEFSALCNLSCPGCFVNQVDDKVTARGKSMRIYEMDLATFKALLIEAKRLGVQTVDIVGAGEPTLDPYFDTKIKMIRDMGMHAVVFTHGASRFFTDKDGYNLEKYLSMPVSFFIKLWSLDSDRMNGYVRGSIQNYAEVRNCTIERMFELGYMNGEPKLIDGRIWNVTRVGADILVMKSNFDEIVEIFKFCRERGIMPEIKTYIPQGPTDFSNVVYLGLEPEVQLKLKQEQVTQADFENVREEIVYLDLHEFGNEEISVIYPQGYHCTQDAGSLYVTNAGDAQRCVGNSKGVERYQPGVDFLRNHINNRVQNASVGCMPRLREADDTGVIISNKTRSILMGI